MYYFSVFTNPKPQHIAAFHIFLPNKMNKLQIFAVILEASL